jgi:hypothetical protein
MKLFRACLLALVVILVACSPAPSSTVTPSPQVPPSAAVTPSLLATTVILGSGEPSELPQVQERKARVQAALQASPFITTARGS